MRDLSTPLLHRGTLPLPISQASPPSHKAASSHHHEPLLPLIYEHRYPEQYPYITRAHHLIKNCICVIYFEHRHVNWPTARAESSVKYRLLLLVFLRPFRLLLVDWKINEGRGPIMRTLYSVLPTFILAFGKKGDGLRL